jgi:hypothetical protein
MTATEQMKIELATPDYLRNIGHAARAQPRSEGCSDRVTRRFSNYIERL